MAWKSATPDHLSLDISRDKRQLTGLQAGTWSQIVIVLAGGPDAIKLVRRLGIQENVLGVQHEELLGRLKVGRKCHG